MQALDSTRLVQDDAEDGIQGAGKLRGQLMQFKLGVIETTQARIKNVRGHVYNFAMAGKLPVAVVLGGKNAYRNSHWKGHSLN